MGMFAGLNDAKQSNGDNYLPAGEHRIKLEALRFKKSENRDSKNENVFIVEATVLATDNPKLKPGSRKDWVLGIPAKTEDKMRAYGDMKAFFAALAGVEDASELGNFEAIAEASIGAANPCRDLVVDVKVQIVTTKKGNPFSKHIWQTGDGSQRAAVTALASPAKALPAGIPDGWVQRADGSYMPPGA